MYKNIILLLVILLTVSCKQDVLCPAYQSFFLLDQQAALNSFSNFYEDSLPRNEPEQLFQTEKVKKYGIIVKVRPKRKMRDHYVVDMEMVVPAPPDSTEIDTLYSNLDQRIYEELFSEVNAKLLERRKKEQAKFLSRQQKKKEKKERKQKKINAGASIAPADSLSAPAPAEKRRRREKQQEVPVDSLSQQ